jgi:hypothetical protein
MKYKVLVAKAAHKMTELVQEYLDDGWTLHGLLDVAVGMDYPYTQVVIKEQSNGSEETESLCEGQGTSEGQSEDVSQVQEADE